MSIAQKTETTLTPDESGRLQSLEAVIERGKQTFIDVGTALMEIRRAKLYRATHATFEAYCVERWAFSKPYATQIIQASQVANEMVAIATIPNEATAREFVSVPKEDRPKVAETAKEVAKEKGRDTINSRDVKEAKAKVYEVETKIEEIPPEPNADPLPTEEPMPSLVEDAGENWLATLPLRSQLQGTPKRKFDEAAEMWRIFEAPFKLLAAQIRSAHKDVPSHLKSRFFLRQLSSFVIDAPQHWLLCKECKGTGQVPRIGNCSSCSGDGFHASSYKGK